MRYATGEYRYQGVLISNCDLHIDSFKAPDKPTAYGGNNHGSILEANGEYYVFYHRHTNGHWYSRQACAERLTMRADGGFEQAAISSCGLNGGPLRASGRYPAHLACYLFTNDNEPLSSVPGQPRMVQDGGNDCREDGYIVDIKDGTTIGFHSFAFKNNRSVSIRVRGYASGYFDVKLAMEGPALARIAVGYSNLWTDYAAEVPFPDGCSRLFLTYHAPVPDDPYHASLQMHSIALA